MPDAKKCEKSQQPEQLSATVEASQGRGRHPNSRRNLRRGSDGGRPKNPETMPETAGVLEILPAVSDQQLMPIGAVESARQTLRDAAPAAAARLTRMINGSLRCDPRVQLQAIRTVLEANAILPSQPERAPDERELNPQVLESLARSLALRALVRDAVDVQVIEPEKG